MKKHCRVSPDLGEIRIIRDSIVQQGQDIYTSKRALSIGFYSPLIEEAEKELEAGNLFKAMELFLRANDVEGPSAKAFCGLGIISYYQKRYQDAFTLFLESIKLNPSDPDTYLNLLDAAKECDLVGDAIKVYQAYRPDFSSGVDFRGIRIRHESLIPCFPGIMLCAEKKQKKAKVPLEDYRYHKCNNPEALSTSLVCLFSQLPAFERTEE